MKWMNSPPTGKDVMTPYRLIKSLSDADIRLMVGELLVWQKSGVLSGDAVRSLADRIVAETGLSEEGVLRDSDTLIMREAAIRFAALK